MLVYRRVESVWWPNTAGAPRRCSVRLPPGLLRSNCPPSPPAPQKATVFQRPKLAATIYGWGVPLVANWFHSHTFNGGAPVVDQCWVSWKLYKQILCWCSIPFWSNIPSMTAYIYIYLSHSPDPRTNGLEGLWKAAGSCGATTSNLFLPCATQQWKWHYW